MLSGFTSADESNEIRQYDYKPRKNSKNIRVPIVLMENYSSEIAIDEIQIRGRFHTIISNIKTSKIILMARTIKSRELYAIVCKYFTSEQMMGVKVVTKDGAQAFDWLSRQAFPNSIKILDKFHVLKWVFDALQGMRNQLRIAYIMNQIQKQKALDIKYKIDLKQAKKEGRKIYKRNYKLVEETHQNGDTTIELLKRSRSLLYKYSDKWYDNQINRASILFEEYPELMEAYILVLDFRDWYSKINVGSERYKLEQQLLKWIEKVKVIKSDYMKAIAITIKKHRTQILNYFIEGYSNATAEALNRNIRKFIGANYGIRNLDFFYFRLNLFNASTSK